MFVINTNQKPGDNDEDKTRHQLHEHAVEPEVDGQHVVSGDPRVLQIRLVLKTLNI